jgi:hypothetical protein
VSRIGGSYADRNPRPVDDTGAGASMAERKPSATLLPPQPGGSGGGDVPDITDLPKAH